MNNQNNIMNSIMQLMQMGQSPEQLIQAAAKNDPQIQALLTQKQQNNMSWKDLTMQLAKQRSFDIGPILNQLSQKGFKM